MVKFGRRMTANRSPQYPPDAYMDYDKLKDIIKELGKKKLARWVLYQGGWESIACGELLGICNDLLSEDIIFVVSFYRRRLSFVERRVCFISLFQSN